MICFNLFFYRAPATPDVIQTMPCPVCDKIFTDQIHLKNHIRHDHQQPIATQHETQTFVLKPAVVQPTTEPRTIIEPPRILTEPRVLAAGTYM